MSAIVDTAAALVPVGPAPRLSLPPSGAGFPGLPGIPLHPLLDAPAPRTRAPMLAGLGTFLVFVAGFGAWATLAPLAEASVAPGLVKVEGSRRTIQHLEGGAVREILFRDGAQVKAGEVIARLDVVQADSQLETQRAQRWALLAQDARLAAEIEGARSIAFADLASSTDPRAMEAVAGQRALFEARQANLNSQVQVLQARIDQQQATIAGARGQLIATRQQLAYAKQEEQMRRDLVGQGLGRLPELLALKRAVASLEGTLEDLNSQVERANAAILEVRKQIQSTLDQRLQDASSERREVRSKLAETEERLRAAADVATRRDIVAPEDGTLVNQKVFTVGGVLRPGDPIVDLVPAKDRLVAEVNVQPNDIDVVYPGLRAEVRLPAFKQRLVPYLHGHVTWVAADVTINEQTRQQYYRSYILIDRDQLDSLPGVHLTPGMPVEAHIQIGERTFFRYMVQPLLDSFTRAFREQ